MGIRSKPSAVPANDRLRPDNRNRAQDEGEPAIEPNKQKAMGIVEMRSVYQHCFGVHRADHASSDDASSDDAPRGRRSAGLHGSVRGNDPRRAVLDVLGGLPGPGVRRHVLEGVLRKFFRERNIRPEDDVPAYLARRIERSVPVAYDVVARIDDPQGVEARAQVGDIGRPKARRGARG